MRKNHQKEKKYSLFKRSLSLALAASISLSGIDVSTFASLADEIDVISDITVEEDGIVEDENNTVEVREIEDTVLDIETVETVVGQNTPDAIIDSEGTENNLDTNVFEPATEKSEICYESEEVFEIGEIEITTEITTEIETEVTSESETEAALSLDSCIFDLSYGSVAISENEADHLQILYGPDLYEGVDLDTLTFTGTSYENTISIDTDLDLEIVFDHLTLSGTSIPVSLKGNADYTLLLEGKNSVTTGAGMEGGAAILVGENASLKIQSKEKGSLYADATGGYENTHSLIRSREIKKTLRSARKGCR